MSDSVDRVFVHALATVRRLPRTGSSRPPPTSRLRLYGLYKQSMEGDVLTILPRPTLPISSPDLTHSNNNSVHRYASRDVRTREAQAEIEKWDAWHACAGMSRTDAKREYISTLIDTMKEYASGTAESRELISELEFVWSQIRSQSGSGSNPSDRDNGSGGNASPDRRRTELAQRSQGGSRPSLDSRDLGDGRRSSSGNNVQSRGDPSRKPSTRVRRTQSGLRVLSPVSHGSHGSINEPIDAEPTTDDENNNENEDNERNEENDSSGNEDEDLNTAPSSPLHNRHPHNSQSHEPNPLTLTSLQTHLEAHLATLRTEIAALREQLSANHLLASSTYTLGHHYYSLTPAQRLLHRAKLSLRTFAVLFLRQLLIQIGILVVLVLWGRWKADLAVEMWVRGLLSRWKSWLKGAGRRVGVLMFWVLDLFGRDGRLGFIGRVLRIV